MPRKVPDDKTLSKLYTRQRLTMDQIAKRYNVTSQAIQHALKRAGIKRIDRKVTLDRDVLYSLYVESGLPFHKIATKLSVSTSTVGREVRRHKLKRLSTIDSLASLHSRQEVERLYVTDGLSQCQAAAKLRITVIMFHALLLRYEITYRHPHGPSKLDIPENDLRRLYVDEGRTVAAVAQIFGCSHLTIKDRLKKLGIPIRSTPGRRKRDPTET